MKTTTAVLALAALAGSASASITYIGSFGGKDYYRNDTLLSYTNARSVAENLFAGSPICSRSTRPRSRLG